jgi:hypothetical protein
MMILLPTVPAPSNVAVDVIDFGGLLTPPLGGPVQRINRIGARYQLQVQLPPMMAASTNGRHWIARITTARQAGARFMLNLDGLNVGTPGTVIVSAATAGYTNIIPMSGFTANYPLVEGQWITIVHGGQRYLYMVASDVVASAGGVANVTTTLPIRTSLAASDIVEIANPSIEGNLTTSASWSSGVERWLKAPSFTIAEAA